MLNPKAAHRKDITTGLADMQHRHFATIATIIREAELPERDLWAREFADRLARTNCNFNRDRFLRACRG
jgi:hypothetical protein